MLSSGERYVPHTAAEAVATGRAAAPARPRTLQRAVPIAVAALIAAAVLLRASWTATPDGDPALHLKLIQDIAATKTLPSELPHFAARIAPGGEIEAMFPYSYTPLYHVTAAALYDLWGIGGVLMLNALAAAVIALTTMRFMRRRLPVWCAGICAAAAFLSPHVQTPFTSIYMEPLLLGFLFPGAWFLYIAMITRDARAGVAAGVLLGLAIATRQSALFYVATLGLLVAVQLAGKRAWRSPRLMSEAGWIGAMCCAMALTAAPSLLYLAQVSGSLGYADISFPGMRASLPIDTGANAYIASITKPEMSPLAWLDRYQRILLYGDSWLPLWAAALPAIFFVAGCSHLNARGGASRFFARWALLQLLAEMVLFVTLHGNSRYVVLSQMLFYATVPAGAYAFGRGLWLWGRDDLRRRRYAIGGAIAAVFVLFCSLVPPGYISAFAANDDRDLRSFRGAAYADMGAWVNANTEPGSIILTPRAYSAELTWERTVTWVTFYGNAWVAQAITARDPAVSSAILREFGVDYVLMSDPPGTYVDRMPATGMRSYLQFGEDSAPYYQLVYVTHPERPLTHGDERIEYPLRLYKVLPLGEVTP